MPLPKGIIDAVYQYCNSHLADEAWYDINFEFIVDRSLRRRLIEEFKGIRFAYKLYEGLGVKNENLIFEIRHPILSYATIYEAVIHYVLYTYYEDTQEFYKLQYHLAPTRIDIPRTKLAVLKKELAHNNEEILTYHIKERKKDESQIRFDDKCKVAEKLGLIHSFINIEGIVIDLTSEIIEIYSYRNAIHLIAEQRKGIEYELELSKRAYRRMRPFINQIKEKLKRDKKGMYSD